MATVLVTGCSSGFGEAIAIAFARRGDRVIATMRNPSAASAALRGSDRVEVRALDVTDNAARRAVVTAAVAAHGRLDVLVNNAGFAMVAAVEDVDPEAERRLFETNYFGAVGLMREVFPVMRKQGGGRIVNVTAMGALFSTPLMSSYCASKHALDAAAAAADIEGRPHNIRVSSVLPGQFKTEIGAKSPPALVTEPYAGVSDSMNRHRAERAADVQTDLSLVVDAVIVAATDPDPRTRYLAGVGIIDVLKPTVEALEAVQDFDAIRAGVPR